MPCQKGGRGGNDGPVGSQVLFQSPPHHLRLCPQETGAATPASILHSSLSGRREHCECRDHAWLSRACWHRAVGEGLPRHTSCQAGSLLALESPRRPRWLLCPSEAFFSQGCPTHFVLRGHSSPRGPMSLTGYPCPPCAPARRPSFPVDILPSVATGLLETHRTADKGPLGNLQSFYSHVIMVPACALDCRLRP